MLAKSVVSTPNTRVWLTSAIVSEAKIMVAATMRMFSAAFSMFFETDQIARVRT